MQIIVDKWLKNNNINPYRSAFFTPAISVALQMKSLNNGNYAVSRKI
jgi:hypothetical protein